MSGGRVWRPPQDRDRGIRLRQACGLPVVPPAGMSRDDFLQHMAVDKKVLDGQLRLVLLKRPGEAVVTGAFPRKILDEVLDADYQRLAGLNV